VNDIPTNKAIYILTSDFKKDELNEIKKLTYEELKSSIHKYFTDIYSHFTLTSRFVKITIPFVTPQVEQSEQLVKYLLEKLPCEKTFKTQELRCITFNERLPKLIAQTNIRDYPDMNNRGLNKTIDPYIRGRLMELIRNERKDSDTYVDATIDLTTKNQDYIGVSDIKISLKWINTKEEL